MVILFYSHYYTYGAHCGPVGGVFTEGGGEEGHNYIYYLLDNFF